MGDQPAQQSATAQMIGKAIHYRTGEFEGRTIRAELHEVQKANLGRKYARVDRRPLDPPPCVWLRLFQVNSPGTDGATETEIENYGDIRNLGRLCHVDLFPVPENGREQQQNSSCSSPLCTPAAAAASHHLAPPLEYREHSSVCSTSSSPPPKHLPSVHARPKFASSDAQKRALPVLAPQDVIWYHNGFPVRESSKVTSALAGGTCVEACKVQYKGQKALIFVFGDLAVSMEGTFILRYRVFDIFSGVGNEGVYAVSAECYGGAFRVYSTKDFPGLQPSTELSKALARWGVRINIRERDRKRGSSDEPQSPGRAKSWNSTG